MLIAEDPSVHVLGFDNEDAKFRHDHMIDLGGAIRGGYSDVVEFFVDGCCRALKIDHFLRVVRAEN